MNLKATYFLIIVTINYSSSLNVSQCHDMEKPIERLSDKVKVSNCTKVPCKLRRNSKYEIQLSFTADEDMENLINTLYAVISGAALPYVELDQKSACSYLWTSDGKSKAACPLKQGQTYVYKQTLEILQIYPRIKTVVHWGLTKPNGKDVVCFEVPLKIVN